MSRKSKACLSIENESSAEGQDKPDIITSKICKNEEWKIDIKYSKEIKEGILSDNCLSYMAYCYKTKEL